MLQTSLRVVNVLLSETDFEVQDLLHSERGSLSDNGFTRAGLIVDVQLIHPHENHNATVKTPRVIAVV